MRPGLNQLIVCSCLVFLSLHLCLSGGATLKGDFAVLAVPSAWAAEDDLLDDDDYLSDDFEEEMVISDPLEPVNRVFFQFNDKLYSGC